MYTTYKINNANRAMYTTFIMPFEWKPTNLLTILSLASWFLHSTYNHNTQTDHSTIQVQSYDSRLTEACKKVIIIYIIIIITTLITIIIICKQYLKVFKSLTLFKFILGILLKILCKIQFQFYFYQNLTTLPKSPPLQVKIFFINRAFQTFDAFLRISRTKWYAEVRCEIMFQLNVKNIRLIKTFYSNLYTFY